MRTRLKILLLAAAIITFVPAAKADEDAIQLKPGDGLDAVEQNCAACHSLDYIQMNSPFLDQKGWTAEVTKMVKAYGAPIEDADQQTIITYLAAHYGKE
jgi:sulfite dehydrogenase (cytochrome) subunit B